MSGKHTYRLINPIVDGTVKSMTKASTQISAGKKIYNELSKHFTNEVKDFYMTLQDTNTDKLYHYRVSEGKINKEGYIDYNLDLLPGNLPADVEKKMVQAYEKHKTQLGGDDSDSSSSSNSATESTVYIPLRPIDRFVYYMLPYYKIKTPGLNIIDLNRIYMPMFSLPVNPVFEMRMDFYVPI